ncbi:FtsX-like permease family protein [Rosistilla carotiformis]|uniref:FtsX-like permease family protein n=1 Tax=Rosistilla carotiformis TaxID=2528017 RepID=A0A518K089_9BACT|nr:ABC transporter permease [Rosistilla carotiformis]QDV71206.1 FtsX-like permease family protein [Rosistilla carotiformis]
MPSPTTATVSLTPGRFVGKSFRHHWRISAAVALGVAAATAVVTGALLVGDSMRGSLRELTIERLGSIDYVLYPGQFFRAAAVDPLRSDSDQPLVDRAVPAILFSQAVVETDRSASDVVRRAGSIQVIAANEKFWDLDVEGVRPDVIPEGDQVVLNASAAAELQVDVGDLVTVRLPVEQAVPADSPLGRRESESEGLPRLEVVSIVPDRGLGRFSLQPSQQQPLAAFLPLELVQDSLDREGEANVVFIDAAGTQALQLESAHAQADQIAAAMALQLSDYGLKIEEIRQSFTDAEGNEKEVFDYYSLTSDRLLLPTAIAESVREELPGATEPVMTYLANAIDRIDDEDQTAASVPYSIITAIDSSDAMPLEFGDYDPNDLSLPVPVVINDWTAEQLKAAVGDKIRIFYFEPETSSGKEVERSFDAVVSGIVPITQPQTKYRRGRPPKFDEAPTVYNDPGLTPTVPGVTDQDSIDDWDLPFKLERPRSKDDDLYWDYYRLTPKAFIPLAAGQRLFGSRFGDLTSLKIRKSAVVDVDALQKLVTEVADQDRDQIGFAVMPTRALQLAASKGTTPFDALFVSLSFFVIVAALMLVALLFRLGMEQRASEYGTLMAVGLSGRLVAGMALREGILVSLVGSVLGVVGGIGYAWLVLYALRNWWVGAVTVPFLRFHWSPVSLIVGIVAGTAMAAVTIWWTSRRLRSSKVSSLVGGHIDELRTESGQRRRNWSGPVAIGCFVVAMLTSLSAVWLGGQAQAGAFVGGGMMLLAAIVLGVFHRLTNTKPRHAANRSYSLFRMAMQSARRNPLRSTLSIGLLAVACFLIVSMSAFQLSPSDEGVGGFDLIGQTAMPLYRDLSDPAIRADLMGRDAEAISDAKIFGFRMKPGQDASCNNLYQASQPQVLGVPANFISRFNDPKVMPRFGWVGAGSDNPWERLEAEATGTAEDPIPMVLDQNTAMWALQMYGGVGEVKSFEYVVGKPQYFQVVGLIGGSVLQGSLLIGEANFEDAFPEISGYQYYLMKADGIDADQLAEILENRLSDSGMDVADSRDVLARLLAVQNTYLRTFQGLGALGLLLGTFGLATVQLRSVLERRGELAVMRATGFSRKRLAGMVVLENSALLIAGIGCGLLASFAAVIPYMLIGQAKLGIVEPIVMLGIVFAVGLLAASVAVKQVLRMPLLESLRGAS